MLVNENLCLQTAKYFHSPRRGTELTVFLVAWKLPVEWATACKHRRRRRTGHRGQPWGNCLCQKSFSQGAFCGETAVVRSGGAWVGQADEFSGITDGLSVDVEDYFQVEAFAHRVPRSQWP